MVNMDIQNGHLPIFEAAAELGISIKTVRRRIKNGKLKATKFSGRWFVDIQGDQPVHSNGQNNDQSVPSNGQSTQPTDQSQLIEALKQQTEDLKLENSRKHEQLERHDQQIQELHQIIAMHQKSIQQLTEQNQLLLEDKRRSKRSWWKRFFQY